MIRLADRYRRLTGALLLTGLLLQGASALAEPPLTKAEIARQKAEQLEQRVAETDKIEPAPDAARLTPEGTEAVSYTHLTLPTKA